MPQGKGGSAWNRVPLTRPRILEIRRLVCKGCEKDMLNEPYTHIKEVQSHCGEEVQVQPTIVEFDVREVHCPFLHEVDARRTVPCSQYLGTMEAPAWRTVRHLDNYRARHFKEVEVVEAVDGDGNHFILAPSLDVSRLAYRVIQGPGSEPDDMYRILTAWPLPEGYVVVEEPPISEKFMSLKRWIWK